MLDQELDQCCKFDHASKLKVICSVMDEHGFYFDTCFGRAETCLLLATANCSLDVSLLLIDQSSDDVLTWAVKESQIYAGITVLHTAVANEMCLVVQNILERLDHKKRHLVT